MKKLTLTKLTITRLSHQQKKQINGASLIRVEPHTYTLIDDNNDGSNGQIMTGNRGKIN